MDEKTRLDRPNRVTVFDDIEAEIKNFDTDIYPRQIMSLRAIKKAWAFWSRVAAWAHLPNRVARAVHVCAPNEESRAGYGALGGWLLAIPADWRTLACDGETDVLPGIHVCKWLKGRALPVGDGASQVTVVEVGSVERFEQVIEESLRLTDPDGTILVWFLESITKEAEEAVVRRLASFGGVLCVSLRDGCVIAAGASVPSERYKIVPKNPT